MNRRLFWILALMPLLITACKKKTEDKPAPKDIPLADQKLLAGVNFQKGSYFVYRVDTSIIDSFWVYTHEYNHYFNADSNTSTEIGKYYAGSPGHRSLSFEASTNSITGVFDGYMLGSYYFSPVSLPERLGNREVVYSIPGVKNMDSIVYNYLHHYDTYSVEGINYEDVYEALAENYFHNSSGYFKIEFRSFYSIKSGLIKFEIPIPNAPAYTWSLIRSHIER